MYSLENYVDQAMANRRATSRTAAGTLDSMSRDPMLEGLEELLAEKRAKERIQKKYPTAAALVMARAMKRVAVKSADFDFSAEGEIPGERSALGSEESASRAQQPTGDEHCGTRDFHKIGGGPEILERSGPGADTFGARRLAGIVAPFRHHFLKLLFGHLPDDIDAG
jgi:hypothetical protein